MRQFAISAYRVTHPTLVLRSPKDERDPDGCNVELAFVDITFLLAGGIEDPIQLGSWSEMDFLPVEEEIDFLSRIRGPLRAGERVFVLRGDAGRKWYIVAYRLRQQLNKLNVYVNALDLQY